MTVGVGGKCFEWNMTEEVGGIFFEWKMTEGVGGECFEWKNKRMNEESYECINGSCKHNSMLAHSKNRVRKC